MKRSKKESRSQRRMQKIYKAYTAATATKKIINSNRRTKAITGCEALWLETQNQKIQRHKIKVNAVCENVSIRYQLSCSYLVANTIYYTAKRYSLIRFIFLFWFGCSFVGVDVIFCFLFFLSFFFSLSYADLSFYQFRCQQKHAT